MRYVESIESSLFSIPKLLARGSSVAARKSAFFLLNVTNPLAIFLLEG
jgi:hypothetical protein